MPRGKPTKTKPCAICGDMFLPDKPSSKICNKDHIVYCPICGKEMIWNTTRKVEPCSAECRKENRRRLNIEKYGCEHPMQNKEVQRHYKEAMLKKYGVESPLQSKEIKQKAIQSNRERFGADWALSNETVQRKGRQTMVERYGAPTTLQSDELRSKVECTMEHRYGQSNASNVPELCEARKQTNLKRYGTDNPMQNPEIAAKSAASRTISSEEIWNKSKQTWLSNLGVDNPSKDPKVIDKMTETFLSRYGVKRAAQLPEFREKMQQTMISRYGVPYYCMTDEYKNSNHFRISHINEKFAAMLDDNQIKYELEYPLSTKSFDFILPDQNILIEIDPTYTHNIVGNHWNKNGIDPNYHFKKSQIASDHGYRCIHIFDWDDKDKIIDMLSPKKRVYARKCEIYKLNADVAVKFLNEYHLQGSCRGQLLCLGLVYQNELLQVMTFGKPRYDKHHDVELLRLCTKPGYTVIGGASRLFSYATNEFGLNNIISYCDRSKFTGAVYEKLGMRLIRTSPPQEVWSQDSRRVTANLLRSRGYDQLFKTNYGKGASNEQLMLENGWLPVYDCGQYVYEYK